MVAGSELEIRAEPSRQLTELDPDGHMVDRHAPLADVEAIADRYPVFRISPAA